MIEFVYFDVGGVVIQDFSGTDKWTELEREIGITSANRERFSELWRACKRTRNTTFDVDDIISILDKELGLRMPPSYSFLMGFVRRFERNEVIWPIISEIQKEVRVGLLTNQYPRMLDQIGIAGLMPPIPWDVVVDSSVVKMQKPDREIYELAQEKAKADKILFVDNSQANLDTAAKDFGWQTFLFDPVKSSESSRRLKEYFVQHR